MPEVLSRLLSENGIDATVDSVTRGGARLVEVLREDGKGREKILGLEKANCYDTVFLQEQSVAPVSNFSSFLRGVTGISELLGKKRYILYATWARKAGSETLEKLSLSPFGMTVSLEMAYNSAAAKIGAEVSYVGRAFYAVSEERPEIELYQEDKSHPTSAGTALAVLVHYKTLTGELPRSYGALGLSPEVEEFFLDIVDGL